MAAPQDTPEPAPPAPSTGAETPANPAFLVYPAHDLVPRHHRALAWGAGAAVILACGLAAGWLFSVALTHRPAAVDPATIKLLQTHNQDLREQIARLEAIKPENICKPGALDGLDAAPKPKPATPTAGQPLSRRQREDLLEEATVLVRAGDSFGTGFFIAPDVVVTNAHVIDKAEDHITVTSATLGRVLPATVVARTGPLQFNDGKYVGGQRDYAVLHVAGASGVHPLQLRPDALKPLDEVTAGGYPGVYLDEDHLLGSDESQPASLIPSIGDVRKIVMHGKIPLVLHSAEISPGNSGGPLIDACGDLSGINTFLRAVQFDAQDKMGSIHFYSLGSADLAAFLREHGQAFEVANRSCS